MDKFCTNCGAKLSNGQEFCSSCGNKVSREKNVDVYIYIRDGYGKGAYRMETVVKR